MYIATVGTTTVEQAETLPQLRTILTEIFEHGMGEDVVVWQDGRRVVLVLTSDGRTVEMDGASLTWTWPPKVEPTVEPAGRGERIDAVLRNVFRPSQPPRRA